MFGFTTAIVLFQAISLVHGSAFVLPKCSAVTKISNKLKHCSTATPFCESFIHSTATRPTVYYTATVTVTSSVSASSSTTQSLVVATEVDTSFIATSTFLASAVLFTESTSTVTVYDPIGCTPVAVVTSSNLDKRGAKRTPSCGLKSAAIGSVSAACSCMLFPSSTSTETAYTTTTVLTITQTVTTSITTSTTLSATDIVTSTPTLTSTPTFYATACPTPTCSPQGIFYQIYDDQGNYYTGSASDILLIDSPAFEDDTPIDVYGTFIDHDSFEVLSSFSLFAPQTGTYIVTIYPVDDTIYIYLNGNYFSQADVHGTDPSTFPLQVPFNMNQGDFADFLVYYLQYTGPTYTAMDIRAPDGTIILSSYDTGAVTPAYVVQNPC